MTHCGRGRAASRRRRLSLGNSFSVLAVQAVAAMNDQRLRGQSAPDGAHPQPPNADARAARPGGVRFRSAARVWSLTLQQRGQRPTRRVCASDFGLGLCRGGAPRRSTKIGVHAGAQLQRSRHTLQQGDDGLPFTRAEALG